MFQVEGGKLESRIYYRKFMVVLQNRQQNVGRQICMYLQKKSFNLWCGL